MTSRELTITRLIDASPADVYRAWTEPELMKQWFAPRPFMVTACEVDPRPGGAFNVTMKGPEGPEFPNPGVCLEATPGRRLVFTDAYSGDWVPSEKPFMTAVITFEEEGGKTRYTAHARHWTDADVKAHEEMGFHTGWSQCADQLEELLAGMRK